MVGKTTTLNQINVMPEIDVNGRVVIQPNIWYTCPVGKKAVCRGRVRCTNRGAAAIARFEIAGERMFEWNNALNGALSSDILPKGLGTGSGGQFGLFDNIQLAAGETIETTQDSGTNAAFDLWARIQETPV